MFPVARRGGAVCVRKDTIPSGFLVNNLVFLRTKEETIVR